MHKMVSSLLTGARLYEFSRHLEYYLWYTIANSPAGFWNRLNPTFTMAEHFFRHFTSTIGTTTPPNTEVWSMSGTNYKIIESFGVSKIPAHDKIRSTSFSGSENLQIRKWLEMCLAKLQNTPQLWSALLTFVGRLWRSRHNTIDAILIQWHVNELRGILKLLHVFLQICNGTTRDMQVRSSR